MNPVRIALLVEGHGEMTAAPVLVRRIVRELAPNVQLRLETPLRYSRGKLVAQSSDRELSRYLQLGWLDVERQGTVILLIDGDGVCPVDLAQQLHDRAARVRPDIPCRVVVAHQEFEAWFIAAALSLRGFRGLPPDLEPPSDAEGKRNAKGWFSDQLPSGVSYKETIDQVEYARAIALDQARAGSRSFQRLWAELERTIASHLG